MTTHYKSNEFLKAMTTGNSPYFNKKTSQAQRDEAQQLIDCALINACKAGHQEAVLFYLETGANINAEHPAPLVESIQHGQLEIANLLLKRGADFIKCKHLILKAIASRGAYQTELLDWVLPFDVKDELLMKAIDHNNADLIKALFTPGENEPKITEASFVQKLIAGRGDMLSLLIEMGCHLPQWTSQMSLYAIQDRYAHSLLSYAGKHNADFSAMDSELLMMSVKEGKSLPLLHLILNNGAKADAQKGAILKEAIGKNSSIPFFVLRQYLQKHYRFPAGCFELALKRKDDQVLTCVAPYVENVDYHLISKARFERCFGSPRNAALKVHENMEPDFIEFCVTRHVAASTRGALELMKGAFPWLKPVYLKVSIL